MKLRQPIRYVLNAFHSGMLTVGDLARKAQLHSCKTPGRLESLQFKIVCSYEFRGKAVL